MSSENNVKVMLLDDEKILLDMYKINFEKHGFEVAAYHDVDDALYGIEKGYDPDVILFDITMPDNKSGYEFLETLKREGLSKRSMKIALTNEGQDGEKQRTYELGADAHLLKVKYLPAELVARVEELLKTRV